MSLRMFVLSMVVGIVLQLHSSSARGQFPAISDEQRREMQKVGAMMAELRRLTTDSKLAKEVGLTADQRRQIQIASQKSMDAMMKMRQSNEGGKFDPEQYKKLAEDMMLEAEEILTPKQTKKLSELAKEREKKQQANIPTQEQMQEMQKLSLMMGELQRLSYNAELAEELGLTAEQRIQLREASQKFFQAMRESSKTNEGQSFDMNSYSQMMGDLMIEAQEILTPEQAEKLARTAKLKRLKQQFGDEFAMIIGLAEDFDLDPKETQELREEIKEAREDYYKKLAELKEQTLERIIGELPRKHREEAREAVSGFFKDDDPRKKGNPFGGGVIRIGG